MKLYCQRGKELRKYNASLRDWNPQIFRTTVHSKQRSMCVIYRPYNGIHMLGKITVNIFSRTVEKEPPLLVYTMRICGVLYANRCSPLMVS